MSSLVIATENPGKLAEFRRLLKPAFDCVGLKEKEASYAGIDESGNTYFENALKKAVECFQKQKLPVLADDSGLEVDALGGLPGVHSARFGGQNLKWPERWRLLLQRMGENPVRTARFRSCLCYWDGKGVPTFFEGTVEGSIVPIPTGQGGFGYDPIFFCGELGKTFGEANDDEKDRVSHRAKACRQFLDWALDRRRPT